MKKTQLYRPSFLSVIYGLVAMRFSNNNTKILNTVGKYKLFKEINPDKPGKIFSTGVYKLNGKKYFIKTWRGNIKDLNYYALHREYNISKYVSQFAPLASTDGKQHIYMPKPIALIDKKRQLSVIYEYIDGEPVSKLSDLMQVKYIKSTIDILESTTRLFDSHYVEIFPIRGQRYYLFALPIYTFFATIFHPEMARSIVLGLIRATRGFLGTSSSLVLAHKDLHPDNLVVTKDKKVYLLDCESMGITLKGYDYSFLLADPKYKKVISHLPKIVGSPLIQSLAIFIAFQYSIESKIINIAYLFEMI